MIVAFLLFTLGLIIGSFLNAAIFRLKSKESILSGRSKCPKCKKVLEWNELVPVLSFVFLTGKCSKCKKKISWQYPLVEVATAVCFVLLYLKLGLTWPLAIYGLLTCFLIIVFVYDLKHSLILDKIVLSATLVAILANLLIGKSWLDILWGVLAGGAFFTLQFVLSRGKWIGGGDIRLGVLMGAILAWQGLIVALFIAYFVGALIAIVLLVNKKKKWGSKIPFGTFLSAATFVSILVGQEIIDWYLNLAFYF